MTTETKMYDKRNGGPYDCGGADSYYQRGFNPHYYVGESYATEKVSEKDMTIEEIRAYTAGYENNQQNCNFKDWG